MDMVKLNRWRRVIGVVAVVANAANIYRMVQVSDYLSTLIPVSIIVVLLLVNWYAEKNYRAWERERQLVEKYNSLENNHAREE